MKESIKTTITIGLIVIAITGANNIKLKHLMEEQEKLILILEEQALKKEQVYRQVETKIIEDLGEFLATAYTDDKQSQGKWVGQTATGVKPQVGVVAVDPKVIPLGTKLYIDGYGQAIAGDTGGAIKGKKIDLFMNSREECMDFGKRKIKVYRIKEEEK